MAAILGYSREPRRTTSARSERNVSDNRSSQTWRTSPPNNLTSKEGSDLNRRGKHAFTYYHCPMILPRRTVLRARQMPLKVSFSMENARVRRFSVPSLDARSRFYVRIAMICFVKNKVGTEGGGEPLRRDVCLEASYQEANFTSIYQARVKDVYVYVYVYVCLVTISFEARCATASSIFTLNSCLLHWLLNVSYTFPF